MRPVKAAVAAALLATTLVPRAVDGREYLGRGLVRDGARLIVADPAGDVSVNLEDWQPFSDPPAGLIVMQRATATGGELRTLDRRGRTLGTIEVPQAWSGVATEAGVVLAPQSLHAPGAPHWLRFLSHAGERYAEVREELTLFTWAVARGGGLATVSQAPGDGTAWVVIGYDGRGTETWRHHVTGTSRPEALLTAGGQLVVLEQGPDAGVSTVTILAHGRGPKSFRLWSLTRMVADPDSSRVAAIGRDTVALFDARTRKLLWQRDEPIDFVLWGGLRFERGGGRLLVVHAERDRRAGTAVLGLRSYRSSDGSEERAVLEEAPLDALPTVVDVEAPPEGGRRVILHDRVVTATPEGAR